MAKKVLKPVQVFLLCSETFLGFTGIDKDTSLINELEGDADYLFEAVGSVAVSSVFITIFDLAEKGFHQFVNIVRGAKNSVVFLKILGGDFGVGGIQVIKDGTGRGEAVSNALVSEGADENFVYVVTGGTTSTWN